MLEDSSSKNWLSDHGPEPRWYIYVAAFVCASFFSNLAVSGIDAGLLGLLGEDQFEFIFIQSAATGLAAGLIWGFIFKWAVRLKLKYVCPIILFFSAMTLIPVFFELANLAEQIENGGEIFAKTLAGTVLHLALFWAVFLGIAVPPRRRLADQFER